MDFNEAYFLGYISQQPVLKQKRDICSYEFQITIIDQSGPPMAIPVISKLEKNIKLVATLRENDTLQIKGHLQKTKEGTLYLFAVDILKLNASKQGKEKAITKVLAHPDLTNNVYLRGLALNSDEIQVERQTKYKSITTNDVLNIKGLAMEPQKHCTIFGTLRGDTITSKGDQK